MLLADEETVLWFNAVSFAYEVAFQKVAAWPNGLAVGSEDPLEVRV